MVPAGSTFEIMTAIAAYHVLGPDFRIPTYLYHGTKPGSYVISGGGDPTLRSGWTSVNPGAPTIIAFSNLARSLGATSASYDSWLYPGAAWHPGWAPVERTNGYMAPMDALMMDGGRADPNATTSPRSANPAWDAGVRFASLTGVRFDPTIRADPSQGVVGMTVSAPVRDLVSQMLRESDDVLAEAIARQVAIRLGYQGSWDQVAPAMHAVMWSLGIDPAAGVYASDGSGLSNQSNASPRFIDRLLEYIEDGAGGTKELTMMLPRNGMAGSLASRLTSLPTGSVYAKTGWVDYGYGLAGYLAAADGTWLRFAVYVWKPRSGAFVTNANRDALDRIIAASWRCGSSLAPS
ncbi:D-alanyl-D-alanine carboxypeptidase DacB [Pseudoclavibacter triregionum]|nr:D-alanyl-D-alanine carboxypeptidase DacB [Pseudoclavibacter triregionum]